MKFKEKYNHKVEDYYEHMKYFIYELHVLDDSST